LSTNAVICVVKCFAVLADNQDTQNFTSRASAD